MNTDHHRGSVLDLFVEPAQYLDSVVSRSRWVLATMMIVCYGVLAMASTYLMLRDEGLVAEYLDRMSTRSHAEISPERLEAARERTRRALQSPGMKIYLAFRSGASKLAQMAVFWIVLGAGAALLGKSPRALKAVVLACWSATPILMLGTTVNTLLRIGLRDLNAVASLLPLVSPCGGGSLWCFLAGRVDIFVLWYLVAVALGISVILRWSSGRASLLVVSLWAAVVVCSFLTDTGAGWTL